MEATDLKALKFREELIKLCDKYQCDICGSYSDEDDDLYFEFRDGTDYRVKAENYSIYKDYDYEKEYVIDEYIINMFNDEQNTMQGLNNVKVNYIIFSNDDFKANEKMNDILDSFRENVDKVIKTKEGLKDIRLKDGTRYLWIKPNDYARGYRCNHAFIDRNLSLEVIEDYVIPSAHYCGKDTVEIF